MQSKIQSAQWFNTYPKCTLSPQELLDNLQLVAPLQEYVIAHELHKDGTSHLHAYLKYSKKIYFTPKKFDVGEFHGNYQTARSSKAVIGYCTKGSEYISNINIEALKNHHSKKILPEHFDRDALELLDEGILNPMSYLNFKKNQAAYKLDKRLLLNKDELPNKNKKRHIWLHGPSNCGKTYKLNEFIQIHTPTNCFQLPYNNDYSGYDGQGYLYADEFKGQITIQDINRMCDGNAKVNTKGGSAQICLNPTLIIVSNYTIAECFNKADQNILDSLYNRFKETLYSREDV
jgi:hypothetical protein